MNEKTESTLLLFLYGSLAIAGIKLLIFMFRKKTSSTVAFIR